MFECGQAPFPIHGVAEERGLPVSPATRISPARNNLLRMLIPRSTYRLQLHQGFDFAAATAVLPYLATLGVSHVYCSPIWRARPGSTHGYDVVEHSRISDELGGEAGFRAFAAAAKARGMGLLLDIVPNHMGVFGRDNPWWLDVLENGQASEFADYFDIDWHPPNKNLDAKLLVPVLGDHYGNVLESNGLTVAFDAARGRLSLEYAEHSCPIDPGTYSAVLGRAGEALQRLCADFDALPARDDLDADSRRERRQRQRDLQAELARAAAAPEVSAAIERAAAELGEAESRDALSDLHDRQAYRLAFWRVASSDINYRRFFDVNSLAALRIEDEHVFEATHGLALTLVAEGVVDGLRVDHSDGLHDPAAYFERLQAGYVRRLAASRPAEPAAPAGTLASARPLYVLAEKIVGDGETVPLDWALSGTTGYDFAVLVNGVFVERGNAERLSRLWRDFSGDLAPYAATVRRCKQRVARKALGAELAVLGNALQRIALTDRRTRDYTLDDLREAIADVAACLPVYRTYVAGSVSAQDIRFVDIAITLARRHTDVHDTTIFDLIRDCLLTPSAHAGAAAQAIPKNRFAMRFQQFSSPVMAKGVEDTAFYRYHRLISLNDVGGSPAVFGVSAGEFHAVNAERLAHWPHTMLASSTHDNKRAEDVRYRLDVLSEQPAAFRLGLRRWKAGVQAWRPLVEGERAPSPDDLYLLYQTLLGSLPAGGFAADERVTYRKRIGAYMLKALREGKRESSWDRPNPGYEAALDGFLDRVLADAAPNPVLDELQKRADELAWFGALNGVSATVLKLSVPGVPDIYQGTETIDLSLVDPDNRRPVDYAARQALLESFEADTDPSALVGTAPDGRLKLWCVWRLLQARKADATLFANGGYTPLRVAGARHAHAIAFARRGAEATLVVIVGRKFAGLKLAPGEPPVGPVWDHTHLKLPKTVASGVDGRNVLTGGSVRAHGDLLALADAFATLPVAAILFPTQPR